MEKDVVFSMECACGAVFEPDKEESDISGDRWVKCPKCGVKLPIPEDR